MKFIFLLLIICSSMQAQAQVDNYAKNSAIAKALDSTYAAQLEAMPNSAMPHWNHANQLAQLTFNAKNSAPEYYLKAIAVDSTNAAIYRDLGDFFMDNSAYKNAYYSFSKGATFDSTTIDFESRITQIRDIYAKDELYWSLHALPALDTQVKTLSDEEFTERTDYPTLFEKTQSGKFNYATLATRFGAKPESFTYEDAFYLLIGQTQQDFYAAYNYDDEQKMQRLTKADQIDEAIKFGEALIQREATNLLVLRELLYCYRVKENSEFSQKTEVQIQKLFGGILYSGDGSCEQPFITLSVQEEYPMAIYLGYRNEGTPATVTDCGASYVDKMTVVKDEVESYLHFNYTPIYISILSDTKDD